MSEPRLPDRPKVTLEQLLKLKRTERPDSAFWEEFDRELHRRQLASVVTTPTWRVRFARSLLVGVRRAVPIGAAATAAVAGFMVLQRPTDTATSAPVETAAVATPVAAPVVAEVAPSPLIPISVPDVSAEEAPPVFERPSTIEPRFVVHAFVAKSSPARTYVSVTSPNTFSSPAYDASLQMVNSLTSGYSRRAGASTAAGSF
jgi:hypothetical protein